MPIRRILAGLGLLVVIAGVTSCAKSDDGSRYAVPPRDAWTGFDPSKGEAGSEVLQDDRFSLVVDERQAEAQALLEARGWQVLSIEQARLYCGDAFANSANGQIPVLLRAVERERDDSGLESHDRYRILRRAGTVRVHHLEARKRYPPEFRRALVAYLPHEPTATFCAPLTVIYGGLPDR